MKLRPAAAASLQVAENIFRVQRDAPQCSVRGVDFPHGCSPLLPLHCYPMAVAPIPRVPFSIGRGLIN